MSYLPNPTRTGRDYWPRGTKEIQVGEGDNRKEFSRHPRVALSVRKWELTVQDVSKDSDDSRRNNFSSRACGSFALWYNIFSLKGELSD